MAESISSAIGTNYLSMLQQVSNSTGTASESDDTEETKTTQEILTELRNGGTSSSKTAQEIADEYGISLSEAQDILKKLQNEGTGESFEITQDFPPPDGSTVSYHV